jgi:2'-5' RNA ligase
MFALCSLICGRLATVRPMISSYAYLYMLLPPPRVRDRIAAAADLAGPMRSPILYRHVHMTLALIANLPQRCPEVVDHARAALAGHQLAGCLFALARLKIQPHSAALKTIGRQPELKRLRAELIALLLRAGMPSVWSKTFSPHVTLGYGLPSEGGRPINPIFWYADRIALVESWRGETHHVILETWPLLPPIQGAFDFAEAA